MTKNLLSRYVGKSEQLTRHNVESVFLSILFLKIKAHYIFTNVVCLSPKTTCSYSYFFTEIFIS